LGWLPPNKGIDAVLNCALPLKEEVDEKKYGWMRELYD